MRKHDWVGGLVLTCCTPIFPVGWGATPGVTTIANPGGGTIAYAQLPQQHTVQGAMGKVLQYVQSVTGSRPVIDKVMKSPDGNSLAVTFSVSPRSGSEISGLALVAVSADGPGAGAVLSDSTDHFRASLKPMLVRLQQEAAAKGGSARAQAAIANAGGGNSAAAGATDTAAVAPQQGTSAAHAAVKPSASAPAARLNATNIPDGSGSVGLPDGWRVTAGREGDVTASGPNGEVLRFGMAQSVLDPQNPQSRALGLRPGAPPPGNFVAIPVGTSGDVAFKTMLAQLAQKQRKPAPAPITFSTVQQVAAGSNGGRNWLLIGDFNGPSGPMTTWVEMAMSGVLAMGGWQMTICEISVPQALAAQEANTVAAMFKSYRNNAGVIMSQINADNRTIQQITSNYVHYVGAVTDATDRSTQAMSNYLRGNTVVSDSELKAHGTVPDDVANALIAADPNRFQAVSSSAFVRGIDY